MHVSQVLSFALVGVAGVLAQNDTEYKPHVLIKPCFYTKLQRYAKFAAASYTATLGSGACPYPPFGTTIVSRISINETDTQAAIYRDDDREEIIVGFPGTTSSQDYDTDFNATLVPYVTPGVNGCDGCLAHGGYLEAWNSIAAAVQQVLDSEIEENPCYSVTIVGHSLGGAIAAVSYPSLLALGYPVKFTYTLGQPRIGNPALCEHIDSLSGASDTKYGKFRRMTHSYDGVPNLPGNSANWSHPLNEFWMNDIYLANGTQVPIGMDNDNLTKIVTQAPNATYRCFGNNAKDCSVGSSKGFINQAHLTYAGVKIVGGQPCAAPPNTTTSAAATATATTAAARFKRALGVRKV